MLACDANADAFPVVASLGDRKCVCARRLNLCPTTFQLCYTLDGVNGYLIGHALSKTEETIRRSGILVSFFSLVVF